MSSQFSQMEKNTVSSENQLKKSDYVTYINPYGKGKRVMFVGNSITLHSIKKEIGWNRECGMAASEKDKDYVHRMISMIDPIAPDSSFCICQVAAWERDYKNGSDVLALFDAARNFHADILIMRFVENCPAKDFDGEIFKKEMDSLLKYLSFGKETKIVMSTGFWHHPADETILAYAKENRYPVVELGDLGETDEMKAVGLFKHSGVANHPGDLGMEKIAQRLFEKVKDML